MTNAGCYPRFHRWGRGQEDGMLGIGISPPSPSPSSTFLSSPFQSFPSTRPRGAVQAPSSGPCRSRPTEAFWWIWRKKNTSQYSFCEFRVKRVSPIECTITLKLYDTARRCFQFATSGCWLKWRGKHRWGVGNRCRLCLRLYVDCGLIIILEMLNYFSQMNVTSVEVLLSLYSVLPLFHFFRKRLSGLTIKILLMTEFIFISKFVKTSRNS